jgi:hypothetical protein
LSEPPKFDNSCCCLSEKVAWALVQECHVFFPVELLGSPFGASFKQIETGKELLVAEVLQDTQKSPSMIHERLDSEGAIQCWLSNSLQWLASSQPNV